MSGGHTLYDLAAGLWMPQGGAKLQAIQPLSIDQYLAILKTKGLGRSDTGAEKVEAIEQHLKGLLQEG